MTQTLKFITGPRGDDIKGLPVAQSKALPTHMRLFLAKAQEWLGGSGVSEYSDAQAATTLDEDELLLQDWYVYCGVL